ncbi:MAG: NAD(P)-dependent oxidoreductase [Rhizobiales bacterium]|nr:NAD(P)-dependent oxidoreductase [Hyphomicrobiales bacterium]
MARVLIFGGTGFIGSHLARHCLEQGDRVVIAARPQSNSWRLADVLDSVIIHPVSLLEQTAIARLFHEVRPDQVYYLVAQAKRPPERSFSDVVDSIGEDLMGLVNVMAAAAAAAPKSFVRAASLAEYGNGPAPFLETQREKPLNSYGASMAAGTHFAQMMQPRLSYPAIHARLALCYGPGQSSEFLIPALIQNCMAGQPTVIRRPNDRRDLIYVMDVVTGLRKLANAPLPGGTVVNLATGIAPAMIEVAREVVRALGGRQEQIVIDEAHAQPDTTSYLCGSAAMARQLIDWRPETSFAEGLQRTLNAIKKNANTVVT